MRKSVPTNEIGRFSNSTYGCDQISYLDVRFEEVNREREK